MILKALGVVSKLIPFALPVGAILILAAAFAFGGSIAADRAELERLREDLATTQRTMEVFRSALRNDQGRAQEQHQEMEALRTRIGELTEYASRLEDRDSVCLPGPDVDRLRDIWR